MSTVPLPSDPDAVAPDGSQVRVLVGGEHGSMEHFSLGPGEVSVAVGHRTLEELWFFLGGEGRMWRRPARDTGPGETVRVRRGVSLRIPPRTDFQFRSDGDDPLTAVGVTMPPWPGGGDLSGRGEAYEADGRWEPTVRSGTTFG